LLSVTPPRQDLSTPIGAPVPSETALAFARLFGPLRVSVDGRTYGPKDFGGIKPKQLLEILLLSRGHPVSMERLGEMLWGTDPPRSVNATLATYVSVLRTRLDPAGTLGGEIIRTEHGAYRVDDEAIVTDLDEFDRLVAVPRDPDPDEVWRLSEALELVRGDLLEDEPYAPWVDRDREHYRSAFRDARVDLAEALLRRDDHVRSLHVAMRAFDEDPTNERACRVALLACYGAGRREVGLRTFVRLRSALVSELQVEPMQETESLFSAIKRRIDPRSLVMVAFAPAVLMAIAEALGFFSEDAAELLMFAG
jgi:SARP family transcriptional regulator, regulator of embCAB operon